jgi:hypothetical protein
MSGVVETFERLYQRTLALTAGVKSYFFFAFLASS